MRNKEGDLDNRDRLSFFVDKLQFVDDASQSKGMMGRFPDHDELKFVEYLPIRFGLEANVPVLNVDGKPEPFSSNLFFQTVSMFHNQAMKPGEREILSCFATASLRFHQRVVNTLNRLYVMTNIRARKL